MGKNYLKKYCYYYITKKMREEDLDYDDILPYSVDCVLNTLGAVYNEKYNYHTIHGEKNISELLQEKHFLDFTDDVIKYLITQLVVYK